MTHKERPEFPDWARRERERDLAWIQENLFVLWPAAAKAFEQLGKGAVIVDTTIRMEGAGNPFAYLSQEQLHQIEDADVTRMVEGYDPAKELVIVLLKPREHMSTYRVQHFSPEKPQ